MNNYQPNLAVNTLLNMDLGRDLNQEVSRVGRDAAEPFSRTMDQQSQKSSAPDRPERAQSRETSSAVKDAPKDAGRSVRDNDDPIRDEVKADKDSSVEPTDVHDEKSIDDSNTGEVEESNDSPVVSEPEGEAVKEPDGELSDGEIVLVDAGVDGAEPNTSVSVKDGEPSEGIVESSTVEGASEEVARADAHHNESAEVISDGVVVSQVLASKDKIHSTDNERVLQAEAQSRPLQEYRVNASGKPIEAAVSKTLVTADESIKPESILNDTGKKSASGAAVSTNTDIKPAITRQLNNMMAQFAVGKPTSATDQAFKELSSKVEGGTARESATGALLATDRGASSSRGRGQLSQNPVQGTSLQAQIKIAIGQPKWQTAVSERVAVMAAQNIKSAEIRLDPPELGPLQVRVSVNQDQASVVFASHHAQVREALDQTAFRLRDMLHQEGMTQVDVDVSDQSFSNDGQSEGEGGSSSQEYSGDTQESAETVINVKVPSSLVDHFV